MTSLVPSSGKLWVTLVIASVATAALAYRVASRLHLRSDDNKISPADKAWDRLYDLWVEVGPAFMPWWQAQAMDMRTSVVRTARDAVMAELGKAAVSMDTLCPELRWGQAVIEERDTTGRGDRLFFSPPKCYFSPRDFLALRVDSSGEGIFSVLDSPCLWRRWMRER